MNIERLTQLAGTLEGLPAEANAPVGFTMIYVIEDGLSEDDAEEYDKSGHSCGTVACIAGFANILAENGNLRYAKARSMDDAQEWLGLEHVTSDCLFNEGPTGIAFDEVTPSMAARTIRHLIATGEVDWDAANPEHADPALDTDD